MKYRKLGKTDLQISILGFGSSPLGDVYGPASPTDAIAAVGSAIDAGINFFDSSPYYGRTLAEQRLGEGLAGKRQSIVLATKCGRYGVDVFNFSRASIRGSVEASLRRLRTDYLDILQAHDVEFAPEQQIVEETIPALRELQAEGKTRYIGITGYPLRLLRRIAERAPLDTILSYCRYALLNTDMPDVLGPLETTLGVGLINASPMMMGLLTPGGPPPWHAAPESLRAAGRRAVVAAELQGASISELALQFSLDQSFAASTLTGMSTELQVRRNVQAAQLPPDPAALLAIRDAVGDGFPTTWSSGIAENSA